MISLRQLCYVLFCLFTCLLPLPSFISIIPVFLTHYDTLVKQWQPSCVYLFIYTSYSYHLTHTYTILHSYIAFYIIIFFSSLFCIFPLSNFLESNIHFSLSLIIGCLHLFTQDLSPEIVWISEVLVSFNIIPKIQSLWSSDGLVFFFPWEIWDVYSSNNTNPYKVIIYIPMLHFAESFFSSAPFSVNTFFTSLQFNQGFHLSSAISKWSLLAILILQEWTSSNRYLILDPEAHRSLDRVLLLPQNFLPFFFFFHLWGISSSSWPQFFCLFVPF